MNANQYQYGKRPRWIARTIEKKVGDWIKSIDDDLLKADLSSGGIIVTGGCIASMLLGERINDFDIYFRSQGLAVRVAQYYVAQFKEIREAKAKSGTKRVLLTVRVDDSGRIWVIAKSAGVATVEGEENYEYFEQFTDDPTAQRAFGYVQDKMDGLVEEDKGNEEKAKYRPRFITSNAISLSDGVQLIIRFYGNPDEIHEFYDYVHCTNYWTREEGLVLRSEALVSLMARYLSYRGSKYPLCSIFRMKKFVARGWRGPSAGDMVKMA